MILRGAIFKLAGDGSVINDYLKVSSTTSASTTGPFQRPKSKRFTSSRSRRTVALPLSKLPTEILGAQVGATISLSQVVALLIDRWDELGESVKAEIAELLSHD